MKVKVDSPYSSDNEAYVGDMLYKKLFKYSAKLYNHLISIRNDPYAYYEFIYNYPLSYPEKMALKWEWTINKEHNAAIDRMFRYEHYYYE